MIKINLATRKQAAAVAEASAGAKGGLGLAGLLAKLKGGRGGGEAKKESIFDEKTPVRKAIVPVAVCLIVGYVMNGVENDALQKVDKELQTYQARSALLRPELAKMKKYQDIKKAFESDLFVMRTKIETINKLMTNRSSTSMMLRSLSTLMPHDVWLTELSENEKGITLKGSSLGMVGVSDFMKNIDESIYFGDASFEGAQLSKTESGTEITTFSVRAAKR